MKIRWLSFLAGLAWVFASWVQIHAQENRSPVTALRATRLFDGKSDELVREGVLLVEGRKILGAGARLSIPQGARVVDLGDATLARDSSMLIRTLPENTTMTGTKPS